MRLISSCHHPFRSAEGVMDRFLQFQWFDLNVLSRQRAFRIFSNTGLPRTHVPFRDDAVDDIWICPSKQLCGRCRISSKKNDVAAIGRIEHRPAEYQFASAHGVKHVSPMCRLMRRLALRIIGDLFVRQQIVHGYSSQAMGLGASSNK